MVIVGTWVQVKIKLVPYEKESGAATMEELLKVIKGAAAVANGDSSKAEEGEEGASAAAKKVKVGVPIKDEAKGPFVDAWNGVCTEEEVERVDVSLPLGVLLAVKDEVGAGAGGRGGLASALLMCPGSTQLTPDRGWCCPACACCGSWRPRPWTTRRP